jgi:hypothetical protein
VNLRRRHPLPSNRGRDRALHHHREIQTMRMTDEIPYKKLEICWTGERVRKEGSRPIVLTTVLPGTFHECQACKLHKTGMTLLAMIQRVPLLVCMVRLLVPGHRILQ